MLLFPAPEHKRHRSEKFTQRYPDMSETLENLYWILVDYYSVLIHNISMKFYEADEIQVDINVQNFMLEAAKLRYLHDNVRSGKLFKNFSFQCLF